MTQRVQQLISNDEINTAGIERLWFDSIIDSEKVVPERLPAEITSVRTGDTNVTTLWSQNRPIAIAVRQRDTFNRTVLTLTLVDEPLV